MSRSSKLDINKADRDELMRVAGLRPAGADALLRHRKQAGRITDLEALVEVDGIGPSTLERLRSHAEVAPEPVREAGMRTAEVASKAAEVPVKAVATARQAANDTAPVAANDAGKPGQNPLGAGGATLETAATSTDAAADVTERAAWTLVRQVEEAAEAGDRLIGDARGTPAGSLGGELSSLWLATLNAQVADGVATLNSLVAARNVNDMVELQARFVSQSVGRIADFQSRSLAMIGKATSGLTER